MVFADMFIIDDLIKNLSLSLYTLYMSEIYENCANIIVVTSQPTFITLNCYYILYGCRVFYTISTNNIELNSIIEPLDYKDNRIIERDFSDLNKEYTLHYVNNNTSKCILFKNFNKSTLISVIIDIFRKIIINVHESLGGLMIHTNPNILINVDTYDIIFPYSHDLVKYNTFEFINLVKQILTDITDEQSISDIIDVLKFMNSVYDEEIIDDYITLLTTPCKDYDELILNYDYVEQISKLIDI